MEWTHKRMSSPYPSLYETEAIPIKDSIILLHFFIGGCNWYIAEYDGNDIFYGYAILNGNLDLQAICTKLPMSAGTG